MLNSCWKLKKLLKNFVTLLEYCFNNNCFVINIKIQVTSYNKLGSTSEAPLLTAVSKEFSISSSSEDNMVSAMLFRPSPLATNLFI